MAFLSPGRITHEEEEASVNRKEEEDRTEILLRRNQRKEHKKPATEGKGFLVKQKSTSTRRTTPSTPHPTARKTSPIVLMKYKTNFVMYKMTQLIHRISCDPI